MLVLPARAHKESYPAHLPPRGPNIFFSIFSFFFVCFLAWFVSWLCPCGWFTAHFALTKRLGKQANIARARDVKLYFRLFRYVNPCVNARWSM